MNGKPLLPLPLDIHHPTRIATPPLPHNRQPGMTARTAKAHKRRNGAFLLRAVRVLWRVAREGMQVRNFDPATDIPALAVEADAVGGAALIVVDPIVSAVAGDSHKNGEVRRALQPLVTMADRLGAAVLGISHFSKGTAGRDPTERVTGSVAFGALSRVVLVAAKRLDADGGVDRMLARAKSNIGPDGGGFGYAVEQIDLGDGIQASRIAWGNSLEGSARDLLCQAEADDAEAGEHRDVDSFLEDLLICGEQTAKAIYRDAEAAGYSRDQIKRAKRRLSVQTAKTGMEGGWVWRLPPEPQR